MLLHPTISKLEQMRLLGMAAALRDQLSLPNVESMSFLDRLGLMVDHEEAVRDDRRLTLRLKTAKLRMPASMADIDYTPSRGLDQRVMLQLASCLWIRRQQNVLITGPTGVGKSFIACALAHKACLENFSTRYYRLHRLLDTLVVARSQQTHMKDFKQLARTHVLVLDDWGLHGIGQAQQRELMELLDDRYMVNSTIVTSQYPIEHWYETMENPTLSDAILDRLVNNAHKIELTGESMRKIKAGQELTAESTQK